VANTVARIFQIGVGFVFAPSLTSCHEIGAKLLARDVQERTNDVIASRSHPGESPPARPAHDPQQDGFGLIVFGMRGGNRVRSARLPQFAQECMPRTPRRDLDGHVLPSGGCRHIDSRPHELDLEPAAERTTESFVVVGLHTAEGVIDVRRAVKHEIAGSVQIMKQEQQGNGVGATGERCDHTRPRLPQRVTLSEGAHALE
jgi:hypothetical protein